jgi:hypothetical protein
MFGHLTYKVGSLVSTLPAPPGKAQTSPCEPMLVITRELRA